MKYRAVANGNILEDVHPSLVAAGIYVPVEDEEPKRRREAVLLAPEAPLENVALEDPKPRRRRSAPKKDEGEKPKRTRTRKKAE